MAGDVGDGLSDGDRQYQRANDQPLAVLRVLLRVGGVDVERALVLREE